jgi:hypothetical protein
MVAGDQPIPADQLAERAQRVARGHALQQQPEVRAPEVWIHALGQGGGLWEPEAFRGSRIGDQGSEVGKCPLSMIS